VIDLIFISKFYARPSIKLIQKLFIYVQLQ